MTDTTLESTIQDCISVARTLPEAQRAQLEALVEETRERHLAIAEATQRARDALDDWRVQQKYILFDREAALREAMQRRSADNDSNG